MESTLYNKINTFFENEFGYSVFSDDIEVYIIGSFADNSYTETSDIDLLVTDGTTTPDPGSLYNDAFVYEGISRTVHISVNLKTGVDTSKPYIKIQK